MAGLLLHLLPLLPVMLLTILLGTLGYLCAILITVFAAHLLLSALDLSPWALTLGKTTALMLAFAVLRSVLRYAEQTCGHYIAFRLLAQIRDKVFGALRRLAPAKLEGKGRGNLIAVLTGDIELLEVFYAHTIAPVCIAVLVSLLMAGLTASFHPLLGVYALLSYLLVGAVLPLLSSRLGAAEGMEARNALGSLGGVFLESLRGMEEILQFGQGEKKEREIEEKTRQINALQGAIKRHEGVTASYSSLLVMALPLGLFLLGYALHLPFASLVMSCVILASSFGPVLALAGLSSAMDLTLASGERVLSLLEEEPETEDIVDGKEPDFEGMEVKNLTFSYGGQEDILTDLSLPIPRGEMLAIRGQSGSGKSTLLKLLMRFWKAPEGSILLSGLDLGEVNTSHLRSLESFMTQDTDLFQTSIRENIRLGRLSATDEEVEAAAKKASLDAFIQTLPRGYDTPVGELGDTLSGGEKQRIGLARAFLHDAPLLLLDEPTSNLDSLNEGIILKSLQEEKAEGRTIVLVSHRDSTLSLADRELVLTQGR